MDSLIGLQSNNSTEKKESTLARKLRHNMDNAKPAFNLGQFHCLLFCVDVKHISEERMAHKCNLGSCPTFLLAQSSRQ